MNCQELNTVLDTYASEQLDSAHKQDIQRHFASCQACREAWAAYNELVAAPIPQVPREELHRRIATALEEREASDAGRTRRSIIIGSALIFGAALTSTLTWGLAQRERTGEPALEPDWVR